MTIKKQILELLKKGEDLHWSVISKRLKKNPATVIFLLSQLKTEGEISNPTFSVIKTQRGFYRIKE